MKTSINIYIIENDFSHRRLLKNEVTYFSQQSKLAKMKISTIDNYIQFYQNMSSFNFMNNDVFIIDIHLNTFFNGVQLAKKIREIGLDKTMFILFLTSDVTKSIDVINQQIQPFGYIVKQPLPNLFFKEELFSHLHQIESALIPIEENVLAIRSGNSQVVFLTSTIYYIASMKGKRNKVIVKTANNEMICDAKLTTLKSDLTETYFFKDLKSYIINLSFIQSYNRLEGIITFKDQSELYFGTKVVAKIASAFHSYLEERHSDV
ncbi:hypothetical protein IGL98_000653 [Enterococcus sp. DIV0840]|uniref:LytR/AlgR family response regulator transcription factor n=1 Tax=Enterococcus TaxID=1350 RepID=UPI001A90BDF9|nr:MULTISPECIES: LytTR family transcriptional regulator DNA-binding domain-containing protein [Enterococcus]MBO0434614.1 LytTR family transcriptional regulator DNA-binding domain-containing protein [Enterococcus sp. DIV0849a]MBO0472168.1 LytTR family transcriptional regulator DNA-binding domain-containing protein [Enterococcus ureasiticus]